MPIYEFTCKNCGHVFEKILPMGTEQHACPQCGETSEKSTGSFLSSAHGLPNGHIGARTIKDVVNKKLDTAIQKFK